MALDRNYFNSINLEPVKKKYYDISEVDNLLVDIRRQAEFINRRYTDMNEELGKALESKEDYRKKGQILSQEIISLREELEDLRGELEELRTRAETAESRAAEAEEKASELEDALSRGGRHLQSEQLQPENDRQAFSAEAAIAAERVEEMYVSMKGIYASGLELLEKQWSRYKEDSSAGDIPADLSSKIGKIASALNEINRTGVE